jgi:hypothetical protein
MNDDPRIKILEGRINNLKSQSDLHFEIFMTIMGYVVRLKNANATLARRIADSPAFFDGEDSKQQFLSEVAQLESECERLESIIAKAKEPENEQPPDDPATPGPA